MQHQPVVFLQRYSLARIAIAVSTMFAACASGPLTAQDANVFNPADSFQKMFETMGENAGPMGPMFGRLTPEQLAQLDRIEVSIDEEKRLGRQTFDNFLKQMKRDNITVTVRGVDFVYLHKLLVDIRTQIDHANRYPHFQVAIIETESEDAYSIPGGHILVTRGLLDNAVSEAALVGVLAHELSHLDHGHQLLPLKQSKLVNKPLNFQDNMLWVSLMARPFRPEQESEADADATVWMMALGYDPRELSRLLSRWAQRQDQQTPWKKFVPAFVRSHPDASKRAQAIAEIAERQQAPAVHAEYIGVENLTRRIPKSERTFRE
jgi:hypothetical protein